MNRLRRKGEFAARAGRVRRAMAERFDDEIRFLKNLATAPKTVGAVAPTSAVMARRMASVVDTASALPVLELGPGTGAITKAIIARGVSPERIYAVEFSAAFADLLEERYPGLNVVRGDAFDLASTLCHLPETTFDSVISGVPLLNFPVAKRIGFVEGALERVPPGRPLIQFTYGPFSPVPPQRGNYTVEYYDFVVRNLPPANLWVYRRAA